MASSKPSKQEQAEINKLLKQQNELLKQKKDLEAERSLISADEISTLETYTALTKQLVDKTSELNKISTKLSELRKKELDTKKESGELDEKHHKLTKKQIEQQEKKNQLAEKQRKLSEQLRESEIGISDLAASVLSTLESEVEAKRDSVDLTKENANALKNMQAAQERIHDIQETVSNVSKVMIDNIQNGTIAFRQQSKTAALISDIQYDLISNEAVLAENEKNASIRKVQVLDLSKQEIKLAKLESMLKDARLNLDDKAYKILAIQKLELEDQLNTQKELNSVIEEGMKIAEAEYAKFKDVGSMVTKSLSKLEEKAKEAPAGGLLLSMFGAEEFVGEINSKVKGALTNVIDGFKTGGVGGVKAMISAVGDLGKAFLMGPQAAILLALAAVAMLIELFADVDKEVSEIQKELGGTKKQAVETHEAAHEMANEMHLVGVNAKEVVKSLGAVSELLGGVDLKKKFSEGNPAVKEMVHDATLLTEKFGLSKDELENVHSLSIMSGKSMAELSGEAIKVAGGVMSTKNAVKLLGGIAKEVAVAFKGSTTELIAAAAKAKMLGMDLKQVQAIGDGMMDIESSLTKEMEARAIIGKDINLDAAREAALKGDVATLQNELLKQAGSLEDFQNMNRIQQKAMADAMGMSVEQMTSMLGKAEEMNKLGLDKQLQDQLSKATAEEKAAIYKKQAEHLSGENKELALRKAKEEESASAAEKLSDLLTKMKESALKLVAPFVEIVSNLMDGVGLITPIFDILTDIGKILMTGLLMPFKLIWAIIQPIFDAVSGIFAAFSSGESHAGGLASIFKTIEHVITEIQENIIEVVKAFVGGLIEPAKIFYTTVLSGIVDSFKEIWTAVSSAFKPLEHANETGEKTAGIMDTIKNIMHSIQPIITVIGKLIAGMLVRPFEILGGLISAVVKIFKGDLGGAANDIGSVIFKMFLGIPKLILSAITGIIDSIFGTKLTDSISGIFDFIEKGFGVAVSFVMGFGKAIYDHMTRVGKIIKDVVLAPFNLLWDVGKGIVKMFQGDFLGGLTDIGKAVFEYIMTPFNAIYDVIKSIISTVGDLGGVASKAFSSIKGMLPSWLGGSTESTPAAPASKPEQAQHAAAATGGDVAKGGMMVAGERGPEIINLPQGATVASTGAVEQSGQIIKALGLDPKTAASETSVAASGTSTVSSGISELVGNLFGGSQKQPEGGTNVNMANVEKKLDTLISILGSVANTPTVIKFGEKTVEEIKTQLNFKKAYTIGIDNGYGRTT